MGGFNEIAVASSGEVWALAEDGRVVYPGPDGVYNPEGDGLRRSGAKPANGHPDRSLGDVGNGALPAARGARWQSCRKVRSSEDWLSTGCLAGRHGMVGNEQRHAAGVEQSRSGRNPSARPNSQRMVGVSADRLGSLWVLGAKRSGNGVLNDGLRCLARNRHGPFAA